MFDERPFFYFYPIMKNKISEMESNETAVISRKKSGFTLMEILLVVALLGGLLALVVPKLANVGNNANEDIARVFVKSTMATPLSQYRRHTGSYPTTEQGLKALIVAPSGAKNWRGPYMEQQIPVDPWQMEYQYRYPGTRNEGSYDLFSYGVDRVESADDVGNWDL